MKSQSLNKKLYPKANYAQLFTNDIQKYAKIIPLVNQNQKNDKMMNKLLLISSPQSNHIFLVIT